MKYIGFYDTKNRGRSMSLAAVNKMNYICGALNDIGESVEIIACGMIANDKFDENTENLSENTTVHFFKTRKQSRNKLIRIYNVFRQNILLFNYLIKNTLKDEQIIVYHSLGIMRCVYLAKKIRKFKLILEVEEFYNDVQLKSSSSAEIEKKFIECADKYIFPTELLNKKFNNKNKPYILIHGTYQAEQDRNVSFGDNKIHVVYAGTFDPRKGGVTAAAAAEWLPENYHIHILGFGSAKNTENIKKCIEETNSKSKATVTYDGLLSGEEYIKFIQKCQIGLSPQDPNAVFNATSFPSKILSYMANGLRVLSIDIPAIRDSDVGDKIYYYKEQTPENIAQAISGINLKQSYNGRHIVMNLDKNFKSNLIKLLNI